MPKADDILYTENISTSVDTFQEHGNEIEEIISKRPPYFVRWGTLFFFILLLMIGFICWLVQYPEIVPAEAKLSSINAPKQVIAKIDGKLVKIMIKENEEVQVDKILGYMESIANPTAVLQISLQLDSMNKLISEQRTDELNSFYPKYNINQKFIDNLGELQTAYQTFIQSFTTFRDFLSTGFFLRKKRMLLIDMLNYQKQHNILTAQKSLLEQDLSLANESFNANESLAKERVISALDYRNEKSKLIAKQLTLPQTDAAIISLESQQNEKRKEIAELENQIIAQKNTFIQALQTMKSQIQAWELKYLLRAPVSGKVSLTGFLQENQEIKTGQSLFYVSPNNTGYFVEMLIPQYNLGKVKAGQQVLLKFQAYPFEQYGTVTGRIEFISPTPSDSGFLAKVTLPNGLTTNYNKTLQYQNGLLAQANIITGNMRLLERFYYNLRHQLKR